jgi:hypothetical protein
MGSIDEALAFLESLNPGESFKYAGVRKDLLLIVQLSQGVTAALCIQKRTNMKTSDYSTASRPKLL